MLIKKLNLSVTKKSLKLRDIGKEGVGEYLGSAEK